MFVGTLHALALIAAAIAFHRWLPASYGKARLTFAAMLSGFCLPLPLVGQIAIASFRRVLDQEVKENSDRHYVVGTREAVTMHESFENVVTNPQSIVEILQGHDAHSRRNAILALRKLDARCAIPVLQKAIQDSDEQVRLLAQTQFNKIMAGLEVGIKKIEAELQSGERSIDLLIRLSELYNELVYLGLSSDESMQLYLERSAELLEEARQIAPEDLNISMNLLRCQVKLGNIAAARERLGFLYSKKYNRDLLSPWESDLLYQDHDWPALVKSLEALTPHPGRIILLDPQINFWIEGKARGSARREASVIAPPRRDGSIWKVTRTTRGDLSPKPSQYNSFRCVRHRRATTAPHLSS